jgi:hypothetical protein
MLWEIITVAEKIIEMKSETKIVKDVTAGKNGFINF